MCDYLFDSHHLGQAIWSVKLSRAMPHKKRHSANVEQQTNPQTHMGVCVCDSHVAAMRQRTLTN